MFRASQDPTIRFLLQTQRFERCNNGAMGQSIEEVIRRRKAIELHIGRRHAARDTLASHTLTRRLTAPLMSTDNASNHNSLQHAVASNFFSRPALPTLYTGGSASHLAFLQCPMLTGQVKTIVYFCATPVCVSVLLRSLTRSILRVFCGVRPLSLATPLLLVKEAQ